MLRRFNPARSAARYVLPLLLLSFLTLTGCNTAPVTYRSHATAAQKVAQLKTVVAPLDAELAEFTAGGLVEPRDDWTNLAVGHLREAFTAETGWSAPASLTPEQSDRVRHETEDVQALMRAITLNHLTSLFPVRGPFAIPEDTITYNTGPLKEHSSAFGEGAVLFVFVRNTYATAGRKTLLAFSLIGAGLTGVMIVPAMGSDVISAALVETDGTVLWFNVHVAGADPRTPDGARELARQILAGLPKPKTA